MTPLWSSTYYLTKRDAIKSLVEEHHAGGFSVFDTLLTTVFPSLSYLTFPQGTEATVTFQSINSGNSGASVDLVWRVLESAADVEFEALRVNLEVGEESFDAVQVELDEEGTYESKIRLSHDVRSFDQLPVAHLGSPMEAGAYLRETLEQVKPLPWFTYPRTTIQLRLKSNALGDLEQQLCGHGVPFQRGLSRWEIHCPGRSRVTPADFVRQGQAVPPHSALGLSWEAGSEGVKGTLQRTADGFGLLIQSLGSQKTGPFDSILRDALTPDL